ncbi:hypothetical protein XENTR_v10020896 [Xenopus tropicalis]|nr:hypothetical protein XENTR_v10020896 [Xenopus tropicalis]
MRNISLILFSILIFQLFLSNCTNAEETLLENDFSTPSYLEKTFDYLLEESDDNTEKLLIIVACFPLIVGIVGMLLLIILPLLKKYREHKEWSKNELKLAEEGLANKASGEKTNEEGEEETEEEEEEEEDDDD